MKTFFRSIFLTLALALILCGLYPLAVSGIARLAFPNSSQGGLIRQNDQVRGSELIGQSFTRPEYFHGRPSANDYDAANSSGSNLGPTSQALFADWQSRRDALLHENPERLASEIPAELIAASASGLDPHISPATARFQASRVSRARGIPLTEVEALIDEQTQGPTLGFLGKDRVNVLKLNLALDRKNSL